MVLSISLKPEARMVKAQVDITYCTIIVRFRNPALDLPAVDA